MSVLSCISRFLFPFTGLNKLFNKCSQDKLYIVNNVVRYDKTALCIFKVNLVCETYKAI